MKLYIFALVALITVALQCEERNPEEAHIYWTNKVTNNNAGETTAEISTQSSIKSTVALDKEAYDQLKKQLIMQLKEELKKELINDPEFMEVVIIIVLQEIINFQQQTSSTSSDLIPVLTSLLSQFYLLRI